MWKNKIIAHYIKFYIVITKDCDFSSKLEIILDRDFNSIAPNEVWCTDITYI